MGYSFRECLMYCAGNKEFVREFDRLTGSNLSLEGPPINFMIDKATGKLKDDLEKFCDFVYECIWSRLAGIPADGDNNG